MICKISKTRVRVIIEAVVLGICYLNGLCYNEKIRTKEK